MSCISEKGGALNIQSVRNILLTTSLVEMCVHILLIVGRRWKLGGGEVELPELKQLSDLGIILFPDQLCGTRSLVGSLLSFWSHMKPIFSIWLILYRAPLILKIDLIFSTFVLVHH